MFNERLKRFIKDKGMTQQILADKLKTTQQTISRYCNGKNEPDIQTLINIADTFDVSIDELVGRNTNYKSISVEKIDQIKSDIDSIIKIIR